MQHVHSVLPSASVAEIRAPSHCGIADTVVVVTGATVVEEGALVVTAAVVAGDEAPLVLTEPLEDWLEAQEHEDASVAEPGVAAVGQG